ncbi:MAG: sugar ABC transporter substrate-binding protein [Verrucomicrobia bacterium]|nr:sugar ABC transporter substrate-binding protein [Verrucomicrobiota bacterium]
MKSTASSHDSQAERATNEIQDIETNLGHVRPRYGSGPRNETWVAIGLAFALCLSAGCGRKPDAGGKTADGRAPITVWAHHGKPEEWKTVQDQVKRFNESQTNVSARLVEIAEANYDTQVQSAAASGQLPDVLEFDGPLLANYVWKGYLKPLEGLSAEVQSDLLPSIVQQGTYGGKFYAVGTFDSGLGLFANRRLLEQVNARVPTNAASAWTTDEFNSLLARLAEQEKRSGGDSQVLDLKRDYRGEWWTYGFYASLVSAGADLIDRTKYQSADGVLNSSKAVEALAHVRQWFKAGYVDPNTDGRAFVDGRAAISWVGHWEYPRYRQAFGEQLVLLPLPNFGQGSRTGMGSWAWGVTRECRNPEAALRFIEFLLRPEEIEAIVAANGAVPARRSVIERSELYRAGGPLHLYAEQLNQSAVARPVTPAYPVITSAFQEVMAKVIEGGDVKSALDGAVKTIDQDIRDNDGYATK